ncbi:rano class II histocompatibility antigen, A beta chain-like isoform X2 [Mastacembelus armatus]|uniref:Rano class II histocompatibility antigen, A beta chain-like n=1 Tax=Mastacembelus armatus TaxID=205130 RepID=A0A3Q3LW28_9TELE|nr:rano class II histocompatibility antigen, A beta chain-like isoform X2 [Mastacembelus armatus]
MRRFTYLLVLCFSSPTVLDCSPDGNGYFMYADFYCVMHSSQREQVEYLVDWYFNSEFTMQYNSTVGNWTGHTPAGLITAALFNKNKFDVLQRKVERQEICVNNVDLVLNTTEGYIVEPSISLQAVETTRSNHDVMLVCSAYDFYPRHIRLTWLQNGHQVNSGVTFSEVMTNGDWTYQVHSYLEYTPGQQHRVSCMVEHASLKEPKIYSWDSLSKSEESYLAGGVCALLFGALFLSWGLVQYRRKSCNSQFL